MAKSMINDLTVGSVPGKLIRFSIPFILANFLQFLYNIVDMIIVGQFVGSAGLSAVSIGGEFMHFFTFIAVGFAQAGQVLIAQSIGRGTRGGRTVPDHRQSFHLYSGIESGCHSGQRAVSPAVRTAYEYPARIIF